MAVHYIENEGALFRGASVSYPDEVYDPRSKSWSPYEGKVPKPQGWGEIISDQDAAKLMEWLHKNA